MLKKIDKILFKLAVIVTFSTNTFLFGMKSNFFCEETNISTISKKNEFLMEMKKSNWTRAIGLICDGVDVDQVDVMDLLENYVDVNKREDGETLLYIACNTELYVSHYEEILKIVKVLLKHPNIDVNKGSLLGSYTPLYIACSIRGNIKIVEALLKHPKIDVNKGGACCWTPLGIACTISGNQKIVEILSKHPNIDVNRTNNSGETPLFLACFPSRPKAVEVLLKHPNIDVNKANKRDETPIYISCRHKTEGYRECVALLLRRNKIIDLKTIKLTQEDKEINELIFDGREKQTLFSNLSKDNRYKKLKDCRIILQ